MKKKLFIVKIFMDRKLKDRKVGFLLGRTEIYKSIIKKNYKLKRLIEVELNYMNIT